MSCRPDPKSASLLLKLLPGEPGLVEEAALLELGSDKLDPVEIVSSLGLDFRAPKKFKATSGTTGNALRNGVREGGFLAKLPLGKIVEKLVLPFVLSFFLWGSPTIKARMPSPRSHYSQQCRPR